MEVAPWAWLAVVGFITGMLVLDLVVFHKEAHTVTMREAALWSAVWIACGVGFGVIVWMVGGSGPAGEYFAGYVIEKSLSVDNIFVFALLFGYFAVPSEYQHRVLFWGIFGALILRAAFIAAGAAVLEQFAFAIYVFGGFLVITGLRMAFHKTEEVHPERNPVLRFLRRLVPMTSNYRGQRFFVRDAGRRLATPMLAVLVVVETTDVVFAIDSIPAIFAITRDTFLVFTSNAFAILGLRALYFLLAGAMGRFIYLKPALAIVLVFVGVKMLLTEFWHIPTWLSLTVIGTVLAVAIAASLVRTRGTETLESSASRAPSSEETT